MIIKIMASKTTVAGIDNHGFQNNRCRDTQQQATPKDKHATIEGKMGYGLARIENETAAQAGQKALEKDAR